MDKTTLVSYLRSSLKLQSPDIVTDEAYKYTDDELSAIIDIMIPAHNSTYTVASFPQNEEYFLILLAKKEVYYRLATATAPLYPLSAEGAELRKDVRFEHYMSLIRRIESEYSLAWSTFESNKEIQVGETFLERNHLSLNNYEHAIRPDVELTVDTIRKDSVDISWSKFEVVRGRFAEYKIYVSATDIYDEYEDKVSDEAQLIVRILDIHRTKYRITGLLPNTTYHIGVISVDVNSLKGIADEIVTTLSDVAPTPIV